MVPPETILNYINAIQCAFRQECKYDISLMKGTLFASSDKRLVMVMDNAFREKQAKGQKVESHHVLNFDDWKKLYKLE